MQHEDETCGQELAELFDSVVKSLQEQTGQAAQLMRTLETLAQSPLDPGKLDRKKLAAWIKSTVDLQFKLANTLIEHAERTEDVLEQLSVQREVPSEFPTAPQQVPSARCGMSDDDLELQLRGERWLRAQKVIAMLRPMDGQTEFMDYPEEVRLERLAEKGSPEDYRLLEGWILLARGEFLAMSVNREGNACLISDRGQFFVPFPEADPFRRLSFAVGKYFSID